MTKLFSFLEKNGFQLLGLLSILPFIILSFYIHPVGTHGWDWVTKYPGELPPNLNFFEEQSYWYNNVMGRYASTALMSITPTWFSHSSFKFFPILFTFLHFGSLYFLIQSIFYHQKRSKVLLLTLGIFILYLDQLTGVYEAFYNLSCIMTYPFGGIYFFFFAGFVIRMLSKAYSKSVLNFLFVGLFIFLAVGSNEIAMIATNGLLALVLLGGFYYHKKIHKWFLGLFVFALLCSFFEILAPGNYARMDLADSARNPILAIFLTLSVSVFNWIRWFSTTPLLIFAILYLPFGIRLAQSKKDTSLFQYPMFGVLGLISFQFLSLFLLFYSQGNEALPERLMDFIFWISLLILLYTWQSLIVVFLEKKWLSPTLQLSKVITCSLFLFATFHLFFNGLKVDKSDEARNTSNYLSIIQTNSNIGNAWLEILNGNAAKYDKEQFMIYEKIKTCATDTLWITPSANFPKIIYDKTYDRKMMDGEHFMSHYFGKNIIIKYRTQEKE